MTGVRKVKQTKPRPVKLKVVTLARLKKLGACAGGRRVFLRVFGKQARITPANLDQAQWEGLSLAWLVAEKLKLVPDHETFVNGRCKGCMVSDDGYRRALLRAARG